MTETATSRMAGAEKTDTSSQTLPTDLNPESYKKLLNEISIKLTKQLPVYQTFNEGSASAQPKFRSTVSVDGVSYTSSNTFPQRKMAEMDVSKIAFHATMQKLKDVASHLVREDKLFCKSILNEYAAKMSIGKPIYQTIQLDAPHPLFRSSLMLNDETYTGDIGKSKKEAEQLAARTVILKYLDSESGNVISEIINCKFRHYAEMNRAREIQNVYNGTTVVGILSGTHYNGASLNEVKGQVDTNKIPDTSVLPESATVQATKIPTTDVSLGMNQPPTISPTNPGPTVLAQTQVCGTGNSPVCSAISAPSMLQSANIPATHANVTQAASLEASSVPVDSSLPVVSPTLQQMPIANLTSCKKRRRKNKKNAKVTQEASLEASSVPVASTLPVVSPALQETLIANLTSSKKRNRKKKKNAQEAQLPGADVSLNQLPTCSGQ